MSQPFEALLTNSKRIIPVIALPDLECALPLAEILSKERFNVLEITLRSPFGLPAIEQLRKEM